MLLQSQNHFAELGGSHGQCQLAVEVLEGQAVGRAHRSSHIIWLEEEDEEEEEKE